MCSAHSCARLGVVAVGTLVHPEATIPQLTRLQDYISIWEASERVSLLHIELLTNGMV